MKVVITHNSPDLDAITSAWLIKRFFPGWEDAVVRFVPAGERIGKTIEITSRQVIEKINGDEVIHVDTGLGPLDHHQIKDENVSAASLTWEFVKTQNSSLGIQNSKKIKDKIEAIGRIVKVVVDIDHFREVFWKDATSDYHEFSLIGILDGLKLEKPDQDGFYVDFVIQCLDALLHQFENRIWAEREIKENGKKFKTRFGEGIGFETINDTVIKLSQKMGYVIVVRKDPRKGYVRIKALPALESQKEEIDLRLAYEKLKKIDPDATWFLHISGKMLLNGSVKNPKMRVTKLPLSDIIKVLEGI
ncbi:MAG: hypothetical protein M1372_01320 [Patescibacteria group bacterium]|nr:hypothetical protein [Patescibacteria group bacterium]